MKGLLSLIAGVGLTLGGITLAGCESSDQSPQGHDALFGGGSGEFGTSPANAGDYSSGETHGGTPAPQPNQNGQ